MEKHGRNLWLTAWTSMFYNLVKKKKILVSKNMHIRCKHIHYKRFEGFKHQHNAVSIRNVQTVLQYDTYHGFFSIANNKSVHGNTLLVRA